MKWVGYVTASGRWAINTTFWLGNSKGRDYLGDQDVDEFGLDSTDPRKGSVTGCCKHSNEY
jgi:hypothetical protein